MQRILILIASLAMAAAACGDTGSTTTAAGGPDPTAIVLDVEENGGCFMMGPNCRHFRLYGDGSFEVLRTGSEGDGPVATGTIDTSLVDALWAEMASADYQVILDSLGPGECRACFDGVDTTLVFHAGTDSWEFDSADVELDATVPLIQAAGRAGAAMDRGFDDFPIISR